MVNRDKARTEGVGYRTTSGFQAHSQPAAQMFIRVHVRVLRRHVESVLFRLPSADSVELEWDDRSH